MDRRVIIVHLVLVFCLGFAVSMPKYLGCFRDERDRAMKGFSMKRPDLRPETCIAECRTKHFRYAATEYGVECYCADSYERYGPANESACSKPCGGDSNKTCGGTWVLSVYSVDADFLGCYNDSQDRAMKGYALKSISNLTPERCVNICESKHFSYAATQYGDQCYCDNSYAKHGETLLKYCSKPCSGDSNKKCGGVWRMSVYSVAKYIGCYKDARDRAMTGFHFSKSGQSVEDCAKVCRDKRFLYAGVQYGVQCYCGNSYDKHGAALLTECNIRCKENSNEMCGGTWRMSVHRSGYKP